MFTYLLYKRKACGHDVITDVYQKKRRCVAVFACLLGHPCKPTQNEQILHNLIVTVTKYINNKTKKYGSSCNFLEIQGLLTFLSPLLFISAVIPITTLHNPKKGEVSINKQNPFFFLLLLPPEFHFQNLQFPVLQIPHSLLKKLQNKSHTHKEGICFP